MAELAGRKVSLADAYRHFGETDVRGVSPLYDRLATAIADSPAAMAAIDRAPPDKRHPTLILAALHDLVLRGRAPDLAAAYATGDLAAVGTLGCDTLVAFADDVAAIAGERQTQTNETGRAALLYPAITLAAQRTGASEIALIDVGCSAGLNLHLDRFGITYERDGRDEKVGELDATVQLSCALRGPRELPTGKFPLVSARIGIDLDPIDVSDEADARWLRACLWPDQPERMDRLAAAIAVSQRAPSTLIAGDAIDVLPHALASLPDGALAVVTTTWALAYFPLQDRLRFLRRLDEYAARRPIAWVSAEGVGIAPGVPTWGDSRRSAHSILGLAIADQGSLAIDAIGRCHPHGRWLEWLA